MFRSHFQTFKLQAEARLSVESRHSLSILTLPLNFLFYRCVCLFGATFFGAVLLDFFLIVHVFVYIVACPCAADRLLQFRGIQVVAVAINSFILNKVICEADELLRSLRNFLELVSNLIQRQLIIGGFGVPSVSSGQLSLV